MIFIALFSCVAPWNRRVAGLALALLASPALAVPAGAARIPQGEVPCYLINRIAVSGEALEAFTWIESSLSGPAQDDPPQGRCLGPQGLNLVLQRAQNALMVRGWVSTRVLLPAQDLSSRTLLLTVVPGRVRALRLDPPARISLYNAVPIAPGALLHLRDLEQGLENLQRVPTAEADIRIDPVGNDGPDLSDLVVHYRQTAPARLSGTLDDSGSKTNGRWQGSVTLSLDNPLGWSDMFYVTMSRDLNRELGSQLGNTLQGQRGTRSNTVYFGLPAGYWLLSLTASSNHYHQEVAERSGAILYSGRSESRELSVSRLVFRDAARKTSLALKGWQQKSNNFVADTEVQVQRRITGGWTLALEDRFSAGAATLQTTMSYRRGTGHFGAIAAPEEALNEGTSRMAVSLLDVRLALPLWWRKTGFRHEAALRVQDSATPLSPADRFSIGSRQTVRGFDGEFSLSAERGWTLRNELSALLGNSAQRLFIGVDHGEVSGPSSERLSGTQLSGFALGLRGGFAHGSYEFFLAAPMSKPEGFRTANTSAGFALFLNV